MQLWCASSDAPHNPAGSGCITAHPRATPHRNTISCRVRRSTGACSPSALQRAVLLREGVSLELPRKQGMFRLEAREVSGRGGGAAAGKGALLGSCQLWVAAARDGSTLFWSHDRCGELLGK